MLLAIWLCLLTVQVDAIDTAPPQFNQAQPEKRRRPPSRRPKIDRPLSFTAASELVAKAQERTNFPLHLDALVYRELSDAIGTKGQRRRFLRAFERLESHSRWMRPIFSKYSLPDELLLVAVVESNLINFTEAQSSGNSAGIWQFVPLTARTYGLRVDQKEDERLHFQKATIAAARYFRALQNQFQDWHLVILGYNFGENRLLKLLSRARSASLASERSLEPGIDKSYLAKVIAAVVLFKTPEVLRN